MNERLRHADINAQRIGLRQAEQFRPAVGGDELADVRVAHGDGAVERRGDAVEIFQVLQPLHIGVRGFHIRLLQGVVRRFFGGFLFADAGGLEQFRPAVGGDFGQVQRGVGLVQFRLGLRELLVQFRRVNFREHLAVGDVVADVHEPVFQIAAGARVNRGLHERLNFGGQRRAQIRFGWRPAK